MSKEQFANNVSHRLEFFYLERGAGGSNCKLDFNIQPIPAGDLIVSKDVNEYAPEGQDYAFVLKEQAGNPVSNAAYGIYNSYPGQLVDSGTTNGDGRFTLKAGQIAVFNDFYTEAKNNIKTEYTVQEDTTGLTNLTSVDLSGGKNTDAATHTVTAAYGQSTITFTNNFTEQIEPHNLENDKYVIDNGDGTYDLSLDVAGEVSSGQTNNPIDVIFVLDTSTSMNRYMNSEDYAKAYNDSRIYNATNAIEQLANSLTSTDARFALIQFGTISDGAASFGSGWDKSNWTDSADAVANKLPSDFVKTGRGTNYEDGLQDAKDLLNIARANAKVVVVFVSDGDPSYYNTSYGTVDGTGSRYDPTAMDHAQIVVSQMAGVDYFFTVGVGSQENYTKLSNLTNEDDYPNKHYGGKYTLPAGMETSNLYGENSEQLQAAFDEIKTTISTNLTSGVTITDILSDNVTVVKGQNGQPKKLVVTVTDRATGTTIQGIDGNGTSATVSLPKTENNEAATLTASYNDWEDKIVLNFPDDYKLEPDYRYTVTVTIEATEAAYENYRQNGNQYHDFSTATKGDYVGQKGVFTNDSAKLTYDGGEKDYPKPVIPLYPKTLTITKTVTGLDTSALEDLKNQLTFSVMTEAKTTAQTVKLAYFTYDESSGTYTYTVEGLSPDSSYTVTENEETAQLTGYDLEATNTDNMTGTMPVWNGKDAVTVGFTNVYTHNDVTLTVKKTVSGGMGDTSSTNQFDFTLTLTKSDGSPFMFDAGSVPEGLNPDATNSAYTFHLASGEEIKINLPYGVTAKVEEEDRTDYKEEVRSYATGTPTEDQGTYTSGLALEQVMDSNWTFDYKNSREAVAPTGLESDHTKPFALMVGAAALAGLALAGSVILRRRRRME